MPYLLVCLLPHKHVCIFSKIHTIEICRLYEHEQILINTICLYLYIYIYKLCTGSNIYQIILNNMQMYYTVSI